MAIKTYYKNNDYDHLLPIQTVRYTPYVMPCFANDNGISQMVYPPENSICTYGFNLPVSHHQGYKLQLSGKPYNIENDSQWGMYYSSRIGNPISTSNVGEVTIAFATLGTPTDRGRYIYCIPTHDDSNENSKKQKIRGKDYNSYDPYLHVRTLDNFNSANVTAYTAAAPYKTPIYYIEKTSNPITIIDGWMIFRQTCLTAGTSIFQHLEIQVPYGITTGAPSDITFNIKHLGSDCGLSYLTGTNVKEPSDTWAGCLFCFLNESFYECNFKVGNQYFNIVRFFATPLVLPWDDGTGIVVGPPCIVFNDVSTNMKSGNIEIYQYGLTFGHM